MSHFTVLVIVTKEEWEGDTSHALEKRLAPFDETWHTPPYLVACDCTEWEHRKMVTEATIAKLGYNYGDLRDRWTSIRDKTILDYYSQKGLSVPENIMIDLMHDEPEDLSTELDKSWDSHRAEYEKIQSEFEQSIPMPKPSHSCSECGGLGLRVTTYNPMSEWDGYTVGGRWNGHLHESIQSLTKFDNNNVALACELAGKYQPFAIVSTDGKWHEKGDMGWWGLVSDEKDKDTWVKESESILSSQPEGAMAILVDCHI